MDTIRDLLEHSERLDDPDRALLLKLIWLHSQTDDVTQREVSTAVRQFLPQARTDWHHFIAAVRALVDELERQQGRSGST